MIPKIIHYCWFGRGKMPKSVLKCIKSWRKLCPDFQIKEWNEDNFDLDKYPYAREAYNNRKFAFVSDVVRLYALYTEGGIYMDTDVEVVRSLNPYLKHIAFSGFESETDIGTGVLGSVRGALWLKDILSHYEKSHFIKPDGMLDETTNVILLTNYLISKGFRRDNTFQDIPGFFTIYPKTVFCPLSWNGQPSQFSDKTVTIHHFAGSWLSKDDRKKQRERMFQQRHRYIFDIYYYSLHPLRIVRALKNKL